jgi:hypothetical protein
MVDVGSSSSCDLVGEGGDAFMMLRREYVRVYSVFWGGGGGQEMYSLLLRGLGANGR